MSKEGSVAPKERVNIVYRPATGDAKEEVELPLKLMVLGDFTQREDDRPLEDRDPVSVDKTNFNDVMKGQGLGMTISVPNKLAEDDPEARLAVDLKFENINDFTPDAIVRQVPELARLLELRESHERDRRSGIDPAPVPEIDTGINPSEVFFGQCYSIT